MQRPTCHYRKSDIGRGSFLRLLLILSVLLPLFSQPAGAQNGEEEQPDTVWKVDFEGNATWSDMILRDVIATSRPTFFQKLLGRIGEYRLDPMELRRDAIRILRFYRRRGFDQADVTFRIEELRRSWQKRVVFMIEEGEPLQIQEVRVEFQSDAESEEIIRNSREFERAVRRSPFQEGERYQFILYSDAEALFTEAMEESGFPYGEVEMEVQVDSLRRTVSLRVINTPGPRMRFGSFSVTGELSVDEELVIRETGIKEGDLYSRSRMMNAQRELFNHHLFRFATVNIPEEPADSTLELTIRVREYPARSIEVTGGIGREEHLRGRLSWTHRNVHGKGHRFTASGHASFIEQRVSLDYLVPWLFNTRSSFVSVPYGQHLIESSFEIFRVGISNSLLYQHTENLTGSLAYDLTYNSELSGLPETSLPDTVLNYNLASINLSGYYTSSTLRDARGWLIQPFLELSSLFGEGTYRYQKLSLDLRRYTQLNRSLTVAARIHSGVIFTGEEELPGVVRFYLGGTNSVRGWSRQSLGPKTAVTDQDGNFIRYVPNGGRAMLNFNLEVRQRVDFLVRGIGLALFLDGGQIWRGPRQLSDRPLQYGAGGGIRYESPIGPVRFDIGYKLNPAEEDLRHFAGQDFGSRLNRFGLHFSIGQAF